jgi:hypothetical protein
MLGHKVISTDEKNVRNASFSNHQRPFRTDFGAAFFLLLSLPQQSMARPAFNRSGHGGSLTSIPPSVNTTF